MRDRIFNVEGPFEVPLRGPVRNRRVATAVLPDFWASEVGEHSGERGCYVFARVHGRSLLPIYVGKTTRTFQAECLNPANREKVADGMDGLIGQVVLFLLSYATHRGKFNKRVVGDLERFLVETALNVNPSLQNKVYTRQSVGFAIPGVHKLTQGRPTHRAIRFKGMLGL